MDTDARRGTRSPLNFDDSVDWGEDSVDFTGLDFDALSLQDGGAAVRPNGNGARHDGNGDGGSGSGSSCGGGRGGDDPRQPSRGGSALSNGPFSGPSRLRSASATGTRLERRRHGGADSHFTFDDRAGTMAASRASAAPVKAVRPQSDGSAAAPASVGAGMSGNGSALPSLAPTRGRASAFLGIGRVRVGPASSSSLSSSSSSADTSASFFADDDVGGGGGSSGGASPHSRPVKIVRRWLQPVLLRVVSGRTQRCYVYTPGFAGDPLARARQRLVVPRSRMIVSNLKFKLLVRHLQAPQCSCDDPVETMGSPAHAKPPPRPQGRRLWIRRRKPCPPKPSRRAVPGQYSEEQKPAGGRGHERLYA